MLDHDPDQISADHDEIPTGLRGDVMYARPGQESSTIRLSSGPKYGSSPDGDSESSGLGSGSRVGSGPGSVGRRNLATLFPAGMPPVEKMQNPLAARYGINNDNSLDEPRTEL